MIARGWDDTDWPMLTKFSLFEIMITDWMMPGVDGLQLLRTLRETEIGRYLYVMVLTAQNDKEKMVEAFNAGADDFLVKPLDRTELLARLKAGVAPPASLPHIAMSIGEPKHAPPRLVIDTLRDSLGKLDSYPATAGLPTAHASASAARR